MVKSILPVIRNKIPNFIKYNYSNAYKLIIDFYTWLETDNNYIKVLLDFNANQEINCQNEHYIDLMLKELGWEYTDVLIDKKLLVNTLRDFYLSRGSLNSFKYLYRILYNEDVNIQYQRDKIFTLSNSYYYQDTWILTSGNSIRDLMFLDIYNNQSLGAVIMGQLSKAETTVNKIVPINIAGKYYYQILINDSVIKFKPNEPVIIKYNISVVTEEILNHPFIKISNHGVNYAIGDRIHLSSFLVNGVVTVNSLITGGIDDIIIQSGGTGYSPRDVIKSRASMTGHSFFAEVDSVDNIGAITSIKIWSSGYNFKSLPELQIFSKGLEAVLVPTSNTIGGIKSVQVDDQYWGKISDVICSVSSESGTGAVFNINTNECAYKTKLTHLNEDSFLGYGGYVFDGDKYQYYSYEVHSKVANPRLDSILDKLVHPIGYKRFGVYIHEDKLQLSQLSSDILSTVNQIIELDLVDYRNKSSNQYLIAEIYQIISLPEAINNIEELKFNENFTYTIKDFEDMTFTSILLRSNKATDTEIAVINI